MADVLIVCVREDEPQAKALADMFEAAGFSIGGAPSSDGALRSSGAGVVVWSQASIRSRPFLDAAQRVINANKAVIASLIEPPPPSSIGDSAAFDLSRWDGDPNDPALDPLFFAVDRMVNAARASVGAAVTQQPREQAYDPPPPPRAAPAPQPRPAPAPSFRVPPHAPPDLGEEAEHWRSIRDSRDPADFMDYLARFGPEGAFSEVAELRLKQLTSGEVRPAAPRAPMRAPQNRPAAPSRMDTPSPTRRAAGIDLPTSTRAGAPMAARRPPIDRDYTRDLREPPKGQGGPLRAIVLIALLGGALFGGLYFGGGIGQPNAPAGDPALETAATPLDEGASDTAELEEAPSVPLSQAVDDRPPRQTAERERQREQERAAEAAAREAERQRQPTQIASAEPSGGPVPLGPGGPQSFSPPAQQEELPAQMASVEPTIVASPSEVRPQAGSVVWTQRPSARRISELYPQRALREGVGGRVVLNCSVMSNLSVNCTIASETPANSGFGRAALSAAESYRARATLSDGASAIGTTTRIAMSFQAPE
jgi:protein TonB